MSPEQASGQPIDGRSDLYRSAACCTRCSRAIQPFSGPSAQALLPALRHDRHRGVRALRPSVPASRRRGDRDRASESPADRFRNAAATSPPRCRAIETAVTPPSAGALAIAHGIASRTVGRGRSIGSCSPSLAIAAIAVPGLGATRSSAWTGRAAPAATTSDQARPAIAVLPFVNISAEPANEYFSDGMTEELINALSRMQGLPGHVAHLRVHVQGHDGERPRDRGEAGSRLGARRKRAKGRQRV